MGTLHLAVSVFALIWKTISLSHSQTLSGHTWSTAKKFLILNLSSLHPYGKPYLGYAARQLLSNCSQLFNNSSWWSDHEFDYSALFAPAQISSGRRCTTSIRRSGTSCGGYNPRYPWQTTWAAPPGMVKPTRRRFMVHGTARRVPQDM